MSGLVTLGTFDRTGLQLSRKWGSTGAVRGLPADLLFHCLHWALWMLWRDGAQHPSPDGFLGCCSLELADASVPCTLVPVPVPVCGEGQESIFRELFFTFTICYVTKMAFQPQGRRIWVRSILPNSKSLCQCGWDCRAGCFIRTAGLGAGSGAFLLQIGWDAGSGSAVGTRLVPLCCCSIPKPLQLPSRQPQALLGLECLWCQAEAGGSAVSSLTRELF